MSDPQHLTIFLTDLTIGYDRLRIKKAICLRALVPRLKGWDFIIFILIILAHKFELNYNKWRFILIHIR
jgi:hypothetical protein